MLTASLFLSSLQMKLKFTQNCQQFPSGQVVSSLPAGRKLVPWPGNQTPGLPRPNPHPDPPESRDNAPPFCALPNPCPSLAQSGASPTHLRTPCHCSGQRTANAAALPGTRNRKRQVTPGSTGSPRPAASLAAPRQARGCAGGHCSPSSWHRRTHWALTRCFLNA